MGFGQLIKNHQSGKGNGFNIGTALKTGTIIIPARVISIVLNETHPQFLDLGEWNALGAIEYELVENPNVNQQYPIAYPLSPNVKNYPLINEIVYLISLPNDLTVKIPVVVMLVPAVPVSIVRPPSGLVVLM